MGIFDAFDINASGLTAQRYRMDIILYGNRKNIKIAFS